ncbi:MAG: helix-turn-helix transcriptional regulator [Actinobacteria bacterium]|nr:helix-turn-helix transcriptional regulator [Actinomycetota bacterium]
MKTKLAVILEDQGRTKEWLSRKTGLSRYKISRICSGFREAKESEMLKISMVLNMKVGEIFFISFDNINVDDSNITKR